MSMLMRRHYEVKPVAKKEQVKPEVKKKEEPKKKPVKKK